jgi:hypothetical protein
MPPRGRRRKRCAQCVVVSRVRWRWLTSPRLQAAPQPAEEAPPSGVTVIPRSSAGAALAPPPPKRTFAHAGGKLNVSYPAGYDPSSRSFRAGAASTPIVARLGAAATPLAPAAADEVARKQKRAERFGSAEAAPAAVAVAADGEADYAAVYAAAAKEQARLRAEFQARRLARVEEKAASPIPRGRGGRGGGSRGAGARPAGANRSGGAGLSVAARLDISLDDLRAKRVRIAGR